MMLQAPYPAIETTSILPNPEFSDVQTGKSEIQIRRSMNNTKRTYVKSSTRELLSYTFSLTRGKSLELQAFIEAYYRFQIKLTNHKAEIWVVNIVNNPFEFTGAGRSASVYGQEYVTIPLELEGIKQ